MPQNSSISTFKLAVVDAQQQAELSRSAARPAVETTSAARGAVKGILTVAVATLALIGSVNYTVDPFQQYRTPTLYAPRYWSSFQRHIVPGMAKRGDYSSAIIGSSIFHPFKNGEAAKALGAGPAASLCLSAATAYEMGLILDLSYRHTKLRAVMIDLNVNNYAGAVENRWVKEPLPAYLWDEKRYNDARYLFSLDTFLRSLDILVNRKGGPTYSKNADSPWSWAERSKFSGRQTVAGLDPANLNREFKQMPRDLQSMLASFDANILSRIRQHPETRFELVHPPYSILVWADFQQRKQVDVTLEFKRLVFERVRKLPNVRVHDFQSAPLTQDLEQYTDIYHYGDGIASWVLQRIQDGGFLVTADNLHLLLEGQRQQAAKADAVAIVARYRDPDGRK
jgi:hypothetical protein